MVYFSQRRWAIEESQGIVYLQCGSTKFPKEREMKSKLFVLCSIFVLAGLILSACGGAASGGKMKTEVGDGAGEVSIISWAGYVERGVSDPAYDWVTEFEKQ